MNQRTLSLWVACALALAGCVVDSGGGSSTDTGMAEPDSTPQIVDAERNDVAPPPDGGEVDVGMDEPDGEVDPMMDMTMGSGGMDEDMTVVDPDMGIPDMALPLEIDSCDAACDRYTACDRDVDRFGGPDECRAECARLTRNGPETAAPWWNCLEVEECQLLHLCPLPQVAALTCGEVCQLAEDCEIPIAFIDCEGECESEEEPFQRCAESLFGECRNDEFAACLARDVYPGCQQFCDTAVGCNVVRPEGCVTDCVGQLASGDGLAGLNMNRTIQCTNLAAMDCEAIDRCVQPYRFEPEPPINEEQFCAAYNTCNFGGFAIDCNAMYARLRPSGFETLRCFMNGAVNNCPDNGTFQLQDLCEGERGRLIGEACSRFCGARNVCGDLEGGPGEVAVCTTECREGFTEDPDVNERLAGQIICNGQPNCGDFAACRETASPEGQCQRVCAALDGCGLGAEDCVETCDESWPRDRHALYRECIAAAGDDCDAVGACALRPAVPCQAACERMGECGFGGPRCAAVCDDAHVEQPVTMALQVGCVLSAEVCTPEGDALSVQACLEDPEAVGRGCLNYCREELECNVAADLSECLTQCVGGYDDREALRYAAAEACLEMAPADAACEVLTGCFPDEIEVDCEAHCQRLTDCLVPAEDCAAACAAAPDPDQAGCIVDALRTGEECRGVAACAEFVPDPASENCARTCEIRDECDRTVDAFLCERACTPDPAALPIHLACLEASVCGEEAGCLELGPEPLEDCQEPCATGLACGAFDDLAACLATCTGQQATPRGDTYLERLGQCLAAAREADPCDVEVASGCFSPILCVGLPDVLVIGPNGGEVNYDTTGRDSVGGGGCGGGGPQQVVVISVAQRALVTMSIVNSNYDPLIHLRSECDDPASEIACNDDFNGLESQISMNLDAGTYFLYLDGFFGREGSATLRVTMGPPGAGGDNPNRPVPQPEPVPFPPG